MHGKGDERDSPVIDEYLLDELWESGKFFSPRRSFTRKEILPPGPEGHNGPSRTGARAYR